MRDDWDQYFMKFAEQASTRGTCDRKKVGAVIVRDRTILSTGYNGAVRGTPHCDEVGHLMEHDHCVRTAHAEANAIVQAARNGTAIDGGTIYTNASPCFICFKLIANAGIKRIVFAELYRDERIYQFAQEAKIELVDFGAMQIQAGDAVVNRKTGKVVGVVLKGPGDPKET